MSINKGSREGHYALEFSRIFLSMLEDINFIRLCETSCIGQCCMQLHEKWNIFTGLLCIYKLVSCFLFLLFFYFSNEKAWTIHHLYSITVYHVTSGCELLYCIEINCVVFNYFENRFHWVYFVILKHSLTNAYTSLPEKLFMYL